MSNHRLFAALYDRVSAGAERAGITAKRAELLVPLRGTVVEIGAGTGANLPHYRELDSLVLIEPDRAMRRRLSSRVADADLRFPVEILDTEVGRDALPLDDGGADAVVTTFVLCSVRSLPATLAEVHRVLRPGGSLVVMEHVRSRGISAALQTALTPVQRAVGGGCRLDRDTRAELIAARFDTGGVSSWQLPDSIPLVRSAIAGVASRRSHLV